MASVGVLVSSASITNNWLLVMVSVSGQPWLSLSTPHQAVPVHFDLLPCVHVNLAALLFQHSACVGETVLKCVTWCRSVICILCYDDDDIAVFCILDLLRRVRSYLGLQTFSASVGYLSVILWTVAAIVYSLLSFLDSHFWRSQKYSQLRAEVQVLRFSV